MINYIEQLKESCNIYTTNGIKKYSGNKKIINMLSNINLFDITKYNILVRKNTDLKYNIPININNNTLLIKINEYYINYYTIYGIIYDNEYVYILFKDSSHLKLICNYKRIKKYYTDCKVLLKYINDISLLY